MDSLLQSILVLSSVQTCFSKLNFLMISSVKRSARCALPVGSESLALCALLLNPALSNLRCASQVVLLTMMWSGVKSRITSSAAVGVDLIAPVMQRHARLYTFFNGFLVVAFGFSVPHYCAVCDHRSHYHGIHSSQYWWLPHVFPAMFLHTINDDLALLAIFSTWRFQISFESRVSPRY